MAATGKLMVAWVPFNDVCRVGKPPLPRRDFTLTPLASDGFMLGTLPPDPASVGPEWTVPPGQPSVFRGLLDGSAKAFVVFGGRGVQPPSSKGGAMAGVFRPPTAYVCMCVLYVRVWQHVQRRPSL